jgi:hypothetical protein
MPPELKHVCANTKAYDNTGESQVDGLTGKPAPQYPGKPRIVAPQAAPAQEALPSGTLPTSGPSDIPAAPTSRHLPFRVAVKPGDVIDGRTIDEFGSHSTPSSPMTAR